MTAAEITAEESDLRNINYSRPTCIILSFDRYILTPVLVDITLALLLKSVSGPGNGRVVSLRSSAVGSGGGVGCRVSWWWWLMPYCVYISQK